MPPAPDMPMWVAFVALSAIGLGTMLLWPLVRALARRLEGRGAADQALRADLDQLHERLADMEQLETRVAELENRVEFSERLLAQQGHQTALPRQEGE